MKYKIVQKIKMLAEFEVEADNLEEAKEKMQKYSISPHYDENELMLEENGIKSIDILESVFSIKNKKTKIANNKIKKEKLDKTEKV